VNAAGTTVNGRVTLAVLQNDVKSLQEDVRCLSEKIDKLTDGRIRDSELQIVDLKARVNTWSTLNSLGAAVAAVMGYLGLRQP